MRLKGNKVVEEKKRVAVVQKEADNQRNRADFLEKERAAGKKTIAEMNIEMAELYKTSDKLQGSLTYIYSNYDLNNIDEQFKSAKRTETWAEGFMNDL